MRGACRARDHAHELRRLVAALAGPSGGGGMDCRYPGDIVPSRVIGGRVTTLTTPRTRGNCRDMGGRLSLGAHVVVAGCAARGQAGVIEHGACPPYGRVTNAAIQVGNNVIRPLASDRAACVMTTDAAAGHFVVTEVDSRTPRHRRMAGPTVVGAENVVRGFGGSTH